MSQSFTVNRDQIIQAALRGLHVYGPTDIVPPEDIAYCAEALNIMVKAWAKKGMLVWCISEVVMPTVAAQATYTIGPTGNFVTPRPLRILSAFLRDANGNDVDLTIESRFDYNLLGQKTSAGVPNTLYYDAQLNNGIVTLYNVPADALSYVHLVVQRQISDFNLATDVPDFPQEFYQALKWGLMDEIALEYEASPTTMQVVAMKAKMYLDEQISSSEEEASVFFTPRFQ